jgi:hypothetical protein
MRIGRLVNAPTIDANRDRLRVKPNPAKTPSVIEIKVVAPPTIKELNKAGIKSARINTSRYQRKDKPLKGNARLGVL